jgi:mono/diheme cytochrome c family protein
MLTKIKLSAVVLILTLLSGGVGSWRLHSMEAAQVDPGAQIKRGEYLVNEVARCIDCHTPRTATGELDMTKLLQGAPTWFTPKIKPKGKWEDRAQDLTMSGLAGKWGEARLVKFLSTGQKADAPMPAYKLTVEDAKAVTAYLRSLPGKKKS